ALVAAPLVLGEDRKRRVVHPDHERERDEDDGPADRDCPERLRAEQVADPQRVDQLEEGLQEVREDDRPGEGCELAQRRPAGEVPPAPRHGLSSTLGDPRERTVTRPPTAASGALAGAGRERARGANGGFQGLRGRGGRRRLPGPWRALVASAGAGG